MPTKGTIPLCSQIARVLRVQAIISVSLTVCASVREIKLVATKPSNLPSVLNIEPLPNCHAHKMPTVQLPPSLGQTAGRQDVNWAT